MTVLVIFYGSNGTCNSGVFGLNFFLYLKKKRFSFRIFQNNIKCDNSFMVENRLFYIFFPLDLFRLVPIK